MKTAFLLGKGSLLNENRRQGAVFKEVAHGGGGHRSVIWLLALFGGSTRVV
jgi:hypothetical protein